MKKEIIVAVDGSSYSDHAVAYITKLFAKQEDYHFHFCSWVTATNSIMPSLAESKNSLIPDSGKNKKEDTARIYLNKVQKQLTQANFDPERFHTSIEISDYNIAACIQYKAEQELPDAIVLGRRGLHGVAEMLMGSVSATMFKSCHNVPLWIIDGEVEHKDVLVPVDGTPASLMAVDHLAHILEGRKDIHIYLLHCSSLFSKTVQCNPEDYYDRWDKEWCDKHLSGDDCLFLGPKELLLQAGIPDGNITILAEKHGLEESHGILKEALVHKCGTVVIGRRGMGITKGLLGGVSDRAVKQVQNLALWVVG
jgi:nucleotide-binding universal stress UspA family protein